MINKVQALQIIASKYNTMYNTYIKKMDYALSILKTVLLIIIIHVYVEIPNDVK